MNAGGRGTGSRRGNRGRIVKRAGGGRNGQQAAGRRGAGVLFKSGSLTGPEAGRGSTEIQAFRKLEGIIKKLRSINERILKAKQASKPHSAAVQDASNGRHESMQTAVAPVVELEKVRAVQNRHAERQRRRGRPAGARRAGGPSRIECAPE